MDILLKPPIYDTRLWYHALIGDGLVVNIGRYRDSNENLFSQGVSLSYLRSLAVEDGFHGKKC